MKPRRFHSPRPAPRLTRRIAPAWLALLVLALSLAACGSAPAASRAVSSAPAAPPAGAAQPPIGAVAAPTSAPAAPPANAPNGTAPSASGSSAQASAAASDAQPLDRMVIRNGKLSLQVDNVERALARVRAIADTYGGYVSASHTSNETPVAADGPERMVADVTIAVRSESYDRAVQDVRQLATKVESEDGSSQDVTQEYVDLDSDLRNLQATQAALLKLMDKANTLSDTLTLQQQLTNVQGQIQRIEGRKQYLEHASAMSTISVSLRLPPAKAAGPLVAPVWSPLTTFERGWSASLVALQAIADVVILAVSFFWWLIPVAAIAYLIYRRERSRVVRAPPGTRSSS